jgi:hypothetical protein
MTCSDTSTGHISIKMTMLLDCYSYTLHTVLKQQNVLSLDRAHDSVFVWRGGILLKKGTRCAGLVFKMHPGALHKFQHILLVQDLICAASQAIIIFPQILKKAGAVHRPPGVAVHRTGFLRFFLTEGF